MRNPRCLRQLEKVSNGLYYCFNATDNGGIHANDSIPNRLYALLNDGSLSDNGHNRSVVSVLPDDRSGKAFFAPDPNSLCLANVTDKVVLHLDSPLTTIPVGASNLNLSFDDDIASEIGHDGGNLKVSVNGGPLQLVSPADFVYNPYNRTIGGSTNPIAGQPAFSGTDPATATGSWGRSIVNLAPYGATPGSTIQLRFDFGNDDCAGVIGWYLDNVQVYQCKP